jgi:hypothetical protein
VPPLWSKLLIVLPLIIVESFQVREREKQLKENYRENSFFFSNINKSNLNRTTKSNLFNVAGTLSVDLNRLRFYFLLNPPELSHQCPVSEKKM